MKPPMKVPTKRAAPPPPKGKGDAGGGPAHGVAIIVAPVRAGQQLGGGEGLGGDGSYTEAPKVNPKAPPAGSPAAQKAGIRKSLNAAYAKQQSKK